MISRHLSCSPPVAVFLLARFAGLLARAFVPAPEPARQALNRLVVSTFADLCSAGLTLEGRVLLQLAGGTLVQS